MDTKELLKKFSQGGEPLSEQEMETLCQWAAGQEGESDDLLLLRQIAQARKYRAGLQQFKAAYRHAHKTATRHSARRLWPAAAAAALLAAVILPLEYSRANARVERWYCNEDRTLQSIELLLEQSITTE